MEKSRLNIQLYLEELKVFDLGIIELNIIDIDDKTHTINVSCNSELNLMDVLKEAGFSMGNCGRDGTVCVLSLLY